MEAAEAPGGLTGESPLPHVSVEAGDAPSERQLRLLFF